MKLLKHHKHEVMIAILVLVILASIQIPRFLQKQKSAKVAHIQNTLDRLADAMLNDPFIFYDHFMTGKNADSILEDGTPVYASMMSGAFELKSDELHMILPDYNHPEYVDHHMYQFIGGHISGSKESWRNKSDYSYDRHWVYIYVEINDMKQNGPCSEWIKKGAREMVFPKIECLYSPTNGFDSPGILFSHTYEYYLNHNQQ